MPFRVILLTLLYHFLFLYNNILFSSSPFPFRSGKFVSQLWNNRKYQTSSSSSSSSFNEKIIQQGNHSLPFSFLIRPCECKRQKKKKIRKWKLLNCSKIEDYLRAEGMNPETFLFFHFSLIPIHLWWRQLFSLALFVKLSRESKCTRSSLNSKKGKFVSSMRPFDD